MTIETPCIINRNEHNSRVLNFQIPADLVGNIVSISFITPNRAKRSTGPLTVAADGTGEYLLTAEVLDGTGTLAAQINITDGEGTFVKKSKIFLFTVGRDISQETEVVGTSTYTIGDIIAMLGDYVHAPGEDTPEGYTPVSDGAGGYSWEASASGDAVVKYTEQTKTEGEKTVARQNIGAADGNDIAEAVEGLASESYVDEAVNDLDESLSDVAKSGSYNDLSDRPTIPSVAGLASEQYVDDAISSLDGSLSAVAKSGSYNDLANKPTIPSITGLASETYVNNAVNGLDAELSAVAKSGDYNDLSDVPTALSDFENDEDFATREFVNSSISTNTANFIGTFNSVAELEAYSGTKTNNDYAFVIVYDPVVTTQVKQYDRYKWQSTESEWAYEYTLNNSSFTADQWAAINSMATAAKITQIATNAAGISSLGTTKQDKITTSAKLSADLVTDTGATNKFVTAAEKSSWSAKQDALTIDEMPTPNSTNPVQSGGVANAIAQSFLTVFNAAVKHTDVQSSLSGTSTNPPSVGAVNAGIASATSGLASQTDLAAKEDKTIYVNGTPTDATFARINLSLNGSAVTGGQIGAWLLAGKNVIIKIYGGEDVYIYLYCVLAQDAPFFYGVVIGFSDYPMLGVGQIGEDATYSEPIYYNIHTDQNTVTGVGTPYRIAEVSALPQSPDANTIYLVTGA